MSQRCQLTTTHHPLKSDISVIQSWCREELKKQNHSALARKVIQRLSCKQDLLDCSCADFVVASRLTEFIFLKLHLKVQKAPDLTSVSSENLCCGKLSLESQAH